METFSSWKCGLYILIVYRGISGQLLKLDDIRVYSQAVTWNEAKDLCEQEGQNMLTLDTPEKFNAITNLLSSVDIDLLTGDYWLGLHDVNSGSTTAFYWNDCRPLAQSDWTIWDSVGNEPDKPSTQRCVRIFFGHWRTVDCNIPRPYICETQKAPCPYLSLLETDVIQNSSVSLLEIAADVESCKAVCDNIFTADTSCWGILIPSNITSSCNLIMGREKPKRRSTTGFNLYIKNCMKVSVDNNIVAVQSRKETYPVSTCPVIDRVVVENISVISCQNVHFGSTLRPTSQSSVVTLDNDHITTTLSFGTQQELLLSIRNMKNSLTVNKSETSTEIRKKISVYESRTSAVSMGLIGTIVIIAVVLFPIVSDIASFIQRRGKRII
ncbi:uncharacterized protein LOC133196996 [Saccostrea echinata]|uniref:uncharacterized protein LOC133196996 n=1 Tax=Saccostrea echinata TaxID=191078 RepID=UPI002A7EF896|nr:uncharacterized protein LOC133196996 [Saccostrea echinata]